MLPWTRSGDQWWVESTTSHSRWTDFRPHLLTSARGVPHGLVQEPLRRGRFRLEFRVVRQIERLDESATLFLLLRRHLLLPCRDLFAGVASQGVRPTIVPLLLSEKRLHSFIPLHA